MTNLDSHIAPKHCRLWGRRNSRTQINKTKIKPKTNPPKTSAQGDWSSLLTALGNWHYLEKGSELTSQRKLFSLLLHWLQWNPEQMSYMRITCQCKQNWKALDTCFLEHSLFKCLIWIKLFLLRNFSRLSPKTPHLHGRTMFSHRSSWADIQGSSKTWLN